MNRLARLVFKLASVFESQAPCDGTPIECGLSNIAPRLVTKPLPGPLRILSDGEILNEEVGAIETDIKNDVDNLSEDLKAFSGEGEIASA